MLVDGPISFVSPSKVTNVSPGTVSTDAATFGQLPPFTVSWIVVKGGVNVAVVDGLLPFIVTASLNGKTLKNPIAAVSAAGVTGNTTVQLRRVRAGVAADILTTKLTIASGATLSSGVAVVGANGVVQTGDLIYVDIDSISTGTAPKGLFVGAEFS